MWDTSVPDWEERLLAGRSLVPDLPLFEDERDRALRVFNRLRLADVPGQPRMAEAAGDWYRDIVAALFGSLDPDTQIRMIQEVFALVPKGNAKTTYSAATMLTAMIVNRRPLAEFLLVAPTISIAERAYGAAAGAIRADEELLKVFHLQDYQRVITHRSTDAVLMIKAADTNVVTGSLATGTLIDETHEFATKSNASAVFLELRGALGKRPDGFLIQITTQSKHPPAGVFKAELEIARQVRDGQLKLNPARLSVLYEMPRRLSAENGWKQRHLWPLVNPNLGRGLSLNFLENQLATAEQGGKEALTLLASQHFNVEIGLAMMADRWVGADYWEAATEPGLTLEQLKRRCDVCVVGIDGGGLDDLLGLTVIGRERETRRWLSWSRAWVEAKLLVRRPEIAPKLRDLEAAGELVIFDLQPNPDGSQPAQDFTEIADLVAELNAAGLLPDKSAVGLDAAGVAILVDELEARGITKDQLEGVPQGYKLNGAILAGERKLADRTWVHADQLLMTWCVGNARTEMRGSAVLITKQVAGKAKIDPLAAAFDAIELMARNPQPKRKRTPSLHFL